MLSIDWDTFIWGRGIARDYRKRVSYLRKRLKIILFQLSSILRIVLKTGGRF